MRKNTQLNRLFFQMEKNNKLKTVRRLYITPTLHIYRTPIEEETNRVIRKHADMSTHFLRVTFLNEKLQKGYYFTDV